MHSQDVKRVLTCSIYKHHSATLGREGALDASGFLQWDQQWVNHTVCDNTCSLAGNGVCNDGRSGEGQVTPPLGTLLSRGLLLHFLLKNHRLQSAPSNGASVPFLSGAMGVQKQCRGGLLCLG